MEREREADFGGEREVEGQDREMEGGGEGTVETCSQTNLHLRRETCLS